MNKRGQVFFLSFMLGIVIIVLALALGGPVKRQIEDTRNANNLDCSNSSIDNFYKATCVTVDLTTFYFIGGLIFIAGAIIVAKLVLQQ